MTELSARICPGCSEVVGITVADEPYIILCGGNCPPHRYDDPTCEDKGHGWTPAHSRCEQAALGAMQAEMN